MVRSKVNGDSKIEKFVSFITVVALCFHFLINQSQEKNKINQCSQNQTEPKEEEREVVERRFELTLRVMIF